MTLPDASRLASMKDDDWARLADRLRAVGLAPARAREMLRVGREASALPRQPLRLWRARKTRGLDATLLRMLFLEDVVPGDDAAKALGPLLEPCIAAGLVVRGERGVVSPFTLSYANDLLCLSDDLRHGGDAVMGAGETTGELARMTYPAQRRASALDLGCGAGTLALLMAPLVPRVVGTDVNERAVLFARINAALNGLRAIEWRRGDLFAPVLGETFELVVSQPPFVARHEAAEEATYLFGGARGDELPLRAIRDLPPFLAPGGRAVFLVMWPRIDGENLEQRVRGALSDPSLGLTMFVGLPWDLDDWCTAYTVRDHPALGPDFDEAVVARRAHLERIGVEALSLTATVVERPRHGRGWTSSVPVTKMSSFGHEHMDAALAARALMAGPREALLTTKLRAAADATFSEDAAGNVHVRFSLESPWAPLDVNAVTYALVGALDEHADVRAAVEAMHTKMRAPREKILAAVEQALAHGVVEVAS
jgi:SAM-dependent methyltransferase